MCSSLLRSYFVFKNCMYWYVFKISVSRSFQASLFFLDRSYNFCSPTALSFSFSFSQSWHEPYFIVPCTELLRNRLYTLDEKLSPVSSTVTKMFPGLSFEIVMLTQALCHNSYSFLTSVFRKYSIKYFLSVNCSNRFYQFWGLVMISKLPACNILF